MYCYYNNRKEEQRTNNSKNWFENKKNNYDIQDGVNSIETLAADGKILVLVAEKASTD